jgi:hypothetical protein
MRSMLPNQVAFVPRGVTARFNVSVPTQGLQIRQKARDYDFVVTKGHALLVSFRRAHSPNAHLLFQEQAALDNEYLLDDWNHDGVALVSDGGHRVDLPTYWDPIDLHRLVREQFIDQLLPLMSGSRDLDASRFNNLLRDGNFLSQKRNDGLAGFVGSAVIVGPRLFGRFHQSRCLFSTGRVVARSDPRSLGRAPDGGSQGSQDEG